MIMQLLNKNFIYISKLGTKYIFLIYQINNFLDEDNGNCFEKDPGVGLSRQTSKQAILNPFKELKKSIFLEWRCFIKY